MASHSIANVVPKTIKTITNTPAVNFEPSFLGRIPIEVRLQIYQYILATTFHLGHKSKPEPWMGGKELDIRQPCLSSGTYFISREHQPALLRTCRQVHAEAVDIMYQKNTFVLHSSELLTSFADIIPRQRFDQIRYMSINLTGRNKLDTPVSPNGSLFEMHQWDTLWIILAGMKGLQSLHVRIELGIHMNNKPEHDRHCRPILEPIRLLRGLRTFELDFKCVYTD